MRLKFYSSMRLKFLRVLPVSIILFVGIPLLKVFFTLKDNEDTAKTPETEEATNTTLAVMMGLKTIAFFSNYIQGRSSLFEWGTGGSTSFFPELLSSNGYSMHVENNPEWCQIVMSNSIVKRRMRSQQLDYRCISPRPVIPGSNGYPVNKSRSEMIYWKVYVDAIQETKLSIFDVIIVDGRWRPACALRAWSHMNEKSILIFHDWERKHYHTILPYFTIINVSDGDIENKDARTAVLKRTEDKPPPATLIDEMMFNTYRRV